MTDEPAPRPRSASTSAGRANPAPRRALPRVTPLGASETSLAEASLAQASLVPLVPVDQLDDDSDELPATGRDLLIPNGAPAARRKGRAAVAVPSLAKLMPSPEQRHGKKPHQPAEHKQGNEHKHEHPPAPSHKPSKPDKPDKAEKAHKHPADAGKDVELTVTVSKALRKRLKAKAADMGMSPEAAVSQLVEIWVDG